MAKFEDALKALRQRVEAGFQAITEELEAGLRERYPELSPTQVVAETEALDAVKRFIDTEFSSLDDVLDDFETSWGECGECDARELTIEDLEASEEALKQRVQDLEQQRDVAGLAFDEALNKLQRRVDELEEQVEVTRELE